MSAAMAIVKELTERHEKRIAELEATLRQLMSDARPLRYVNSFASHVHMAADAALRKSGL